MLHSRWFYVNGIVTMWQLYKKEARAAIALFATEAFLYASAGLEDPFQNPLGEDFHVQVA
jgi:hypothetical protein